MSFLHNFVKNNQINELEKELKKNNINLNIKDKYNRTPLHYACSKGYIEIVKILIKDPRIEINVFDKYYYTPFHLACIYNHLNIVKILINNSKIEINTYGGFVADTPFHSACTSEIFNERSSS